MAPTTPPAHPEPTVRQRSFDDLGQPLSEVTFVVVDLETTGASPADCGITEIGAVKLRGGVCLGTFATLVDPGRPIPPLITHLTGITEMMVTAAPRIGQVLPTLVEFVGDAVVVGHNVAFDLRFLAAALAERGDAPLSNRVVDTCALARRLVRDEVRDCKLATLADQYRLAHRPRHRALDDALATGDLLHVLLERAASWGVLALEDLVEMPTTRGHPHFSKRTLAADLPAAPGVYVFRDRGGRVLYVGRAVDLRRRVRSYFGAGEDRRKAGPLLRELHRIDHVVCANELEAGVLEVRLIHHLTPRFNRQATTWRRYAYVKLTLAEAWPRLALVRTTPADGSLYLGPVSSSRSGRLVIDAIETAVGLRRCRGPVRPGAPRPAPCVPAQLGRALCPCAGGLDPAAYRPVVEAARRGLTEEPGTLLSPLARRLARLAAERRYEEAAEVRDRAGALARTLVRQRRFDALRRTGRLVVEVPGDGGAELLAGHLVTAWGPGGRPLHPTLATRRRGCGDSTLEMADRLLDRSSAAAPDLLPGPDRPLARDDVDEAVWVSQWLERRAAVLRVLEAGTGLAWPATRVPFFEPGTRLAS